VDEVVAACSVRLELPGAWRMYLLTVVDALDLAHEVGEVAHLGDLRVGK
jgi:hypothetical protein